MRRCEYSEEQIVEGRVCAGIVKWLMEVEKRIERKERGVTVHERVKIFL